jgi:hypothetical protein
MASAAASAAGIVLLLAAVASLSGPVPGPV